MDERVNPSPHNSGGGIPSGLAGAPGGAFMPFEKAECETSLSNRFKRAAALYADRVAVSHRGREVTYAELDEMAEAVASALL